MKTYRVYQHSDIGSRNIDALAHSVGGRWHDTAPVGDLVVGFITMPDDAAACSYLEELLDADSQVESYDIWLEDDPTPQN